MTVAVHKWQSKLWSWCSLPDHVGLGKPLWPLHKDSSVVANYMFIPLNVELVSCAGSQLQPEGLSWSTVGRLSLVHLLTP